MGRGDVGRLGEDPLGVTICGERMDGKEGSRVRMVIEYPPLHGIRQSRSSFLLSCFHVT